MAVNKIIVRTYVRPVETVRKNFTQLCKYAFIHEKNFEKFDTIASGSRMEWHGRGERLGEADILAEWEWDMIEIRLSNSVNCKSTYTVCEVRVEVSCFMVRGSVEVEVERGGALHHTSPHQGRRPAPLTALFCSTLGSGGRYQKPSVVIFMLPKTLRAVDSVPVEEIGCTQATKKNCSYAQYDTVQYSIACGVVKCRYTCAARPPSFPVLLPPPVLLLPLTLS